MNARTSLTAARVEEAIAHLLGRDFNSVSGAMHSGILGGRWSRREPIKKLLALNYRFMRGAQAACEDTRVGPIRRSNRLLFLSGASFGNDSEPSSAPR